MKLAVFDGTRVGVVTGNEIRDVSEVVPFARGEWPPVFVNQMIREWDEIRPRVEDLLDKAPALPLDSVRLEAPNPCPIHILAAPGNYGRHLDEFSATTSVKDLGFFFKASGSVLRPGGRVILPKGSDRSFHHEAELAVVIGRTCKDVPVEEVPERIFGYTCLMDITMRMTRERQEERVLRKSFDTFTPIGPWIVTSDELPDPQDLQMDLWVNDELRQSATTADMILGVYELVSYASSVMTLQPGDIFTTGTPEGVGEIVAGDTASITIEEIGSFSVTVGVADREAPYVF